MRAKFKTFWDTFLREFLRFMLVGGSATVVDFLVMSLVLYAMQPALYPSFLAVFIGKTAPSTAATVVATGCGFVASVLLNYLLSVLFVYREKGISRSWRGFFLFLLLASGGLAIHVGGMALGFDLLGVNEWLVKIVLTLVVFVYNYVTRKTLIFRDRIRKRTPRRPDACPARLRENGCAACAAHCPARRSASA